MPAVLEDERFLLAQVLRMEHGLIKTQIQSLGLDRGMLPVLFNLSEGKQKNQRELARQLHLAPTTIHATVKKLTNQGLLQRLPDEDGRVVRLMLTAQGERLAAKAREQFAQVHQHMLEGFTPEEHLLLRRFLLQMRENLQSLEKTLE